MNVQVSNWGPQISFLFFRTRHGAGPGNGLEKSPRAADRRILHSLTRRSRIWLSFDEKMMIFHSFSRLFTNFFTVFQDLFTVFQDCSWLFTIFHDFSRCFTMFHDFSRFFTIFHNFSQFFTIFHPDFTRILGVENGFRNTENGRWPYRCEAFSAEISFPSSDRAGEAQKAGFRPNFWPEFARKFLAEFLAEFFPAVAIYARERRVTGL